MIPEKPSGPHPDSETLLRAARAPSDPMSRDVLGHAVMCATCSEELAAIEVFSARSPDLFGVEARRARAAWTKFGGMRDPRRAAIGLFSAFAMAAAVCLAVALAVLLPRREDEVMRGGEVPPDVFVPSGEISAPPLEFRFPRSGAARVRVSVFDAERQYVWTSPASQSDQPVPFPPEEGAKLRPGIPYTWVVLGEGPTLPARTFHIRAGATR